MKRPARSEPLHDSAELHVQGNALYIEDLPRLEGELALATVGAPCARGRVTAVHLDAARAVPGVVAVLDHRDIPGHNCWGPIFEDEPFLVVDEIGYLGQPVVIVVAESRAAALAGCAAVKIEAAAEPPVLSIDEADRRGLHIGVERFIRRGDPGAGWAAAKQRVEGVFESGGQEQFYLESQAALAIPDEGSAMVVHSSTQNPTEIQKVVAELLGWRQNQVVCLCRRMGGGFGGKETQGSLPAAFAALAAWKCGRPVRVVYTKDEDMLLTGKRHAVRTAYSIGCDETGRILAAEFVVRSNGGAYADLSTAVLERTMLHLDNAYFLPHVAIAARVCRTNLPPNTAFRGFGGPQAMAVIENVMEEIALTLGKDALTVRRANLYSADPASERAMTPYGQRLTNNRLPEIFDRLEASSDYGARRARIEGSNEREPVALSGLALVPVKFGISFTNKMLNQANALVNVYTDGTVQVSTGATEMGQGVNTKLALIVAAELGISFERVVVMTTSTEKNNNTSPTAASASTDLNGSAAIDACRQIRARLVELAADLFADPAAGLERSPADVRFDDDRCWDVRAPATRALSFAELTQRARTERVDLGARGFYATPDIGFDRESGQGTPFAYYTTGACVAEVKIDRLLGTLEVSRLDVLMDIGKPIHLAIELGQIYGGLVQGIGWVTAEELVYDERGFLLSHSPTTYKIPNITDIAPEFHVDLLDSDGVPQILRSTKAVGEPPLMLGIAVWCAIKNALSYASRREGAAGGGRGAIPDLGLPATHEAIALAAEKLGRPQ
ncbi:MAG: xanthine dehydrogenase molybdopterin binding subunit [Thermoanaerobaculia bacterium]